MNYRRGKQTAIWTFVGLILLAELYVNDVLVMDYPDVALNILLMVFMTYLLGELIWLFTQNHYLGYLLIHTSLKKRDIKTVYTIVGCSRMSKNVTYPEFNEIVDNAYVTCLRKMVGSEEDIYQAVIASAYVSYKNLWLENPRGMLPEIRAIEQRHYDFVKMVEAFYNYSK